jgi:predicted esterase
MIMLRTDKDMIRATRSRRDFLILAGAFGLGCATPRLAATAQVGQPRFFVSHGRADDVLPIARCSRRLVPQLKRAGYDVDYREFEGGHTVPGNIAHDAMAWFLS